MANKPIRVRIQLGPDLPAYMGQVTDAETGQEINYVKSVDLHLENPVKVTDIDTGREFSNVKSVDLRLDASDGHKFPIAHLEVYMPMVDVSVQAEVTTICPCCNRPLEQEHPLQGDDQVL